MNVTSLIYYFDKDIRNVDDKKYKDLLVPEKIAILNRASDILFDKVFLNRDKDPRFNEWLKPFFKDGDDLELIKKGKDCNVYKYPPGQNSITSIYVNVSSGGCTATFDATPIMKQSFSSALTNSFWEPSFEFEQTFRTMDQEGIAIYHKGNFNIDKAIINWVSRPVEFHAPKLVKPEGIYVYHDGKTIKENVNPNWGEGAYLYLVDIAVMLAVDNPSDLNLEVNKKLNIKNNL